MADLEDAGTSQVSFRAFEGMADVILSSDENITEDTTLQTLQVYYSFPTVPPPNY